jgi:hypothetical protein
MSAREPWYIEPHTATYRVVSAANHAGERLAMLAAIGALQFEALSIGTRRGQVAIVPLDESSRENAEFIVRACNAHDAMLDALCKARDELRRLHARTAGSISAALGDVCAAIAKAKGGAA